MAIESPHPEEKHRSGRANWLRAAVLGVNDGLISTSSIMVGVIAAQVDYRIIITAGIASLVAGAFSMAAGEFVSVSSQRDSENEDIEIERRAHKNHPEKELEELAHIYEERGLSPALAKQVAAELHENDSVTAHARDELGITDERQPSPWQAAAASALAFSIGAVVPIAAAVIGKDHGGAWLIVVATLAMLTISGAIGAVIGGGNRIVAALRVLLGGGIAMAVTAAIGSIAGVAL